MPRKLRTRIIEDSSSDSDEKVLEEKKEEEEDFSKEEEEEFDEEEVLEEIYDIILSPNTFDTLAEKFPQLLDVLPPIPNMKEIMDANIMKRDRTNILRYYIIYQNASPFTIDWFEARQGLFEEYEQAKKREGDLTKDMEEVINELEQGTLVETNLEVNIAKLKLDQKYKLQIFKRYKQLERMEPTHDEYPKLQEWLSRVMEIPWGVYHQIQESHQAILRRLMVQLDSEFYGLTEVKEQVLLYMYNRLKHPNAKMAALGFIGSPGTGKTFLAHLIARALQLPFHQLSGGALNNPHLIHGHSYTYVGADMGAIAKACTEMKSLNGILFIDEFDKITSGSGLSEKCLNMFLHILDPNQNNSFHDHYIGEIPIDLSKMWFIMSMNYLPDNRALQDRIFQIHIKDYTKTDKTKILKNYVIPSLCRDLDFYPTFTDDALSVVVEQSSSETGMRKIIQLMQDVMRKLSFKTYANEIKTSFTNVEWDLSQPVTRGVIQKLVLSETLQKTVSKPPDSLYY